VAFGAEYLHVVRAVCILWSFELCIWLDMVNLYFPWVECFLAPCTDGTIPEKYFLSQVYLPRPVFSESDVVVAEETFPLHAFFLFSDCIFFGIGIVPGPGQVFLGRILPWHDQRFCSVSEGVALAESSHDCWHVAVVFST